MAKGIKKNSTAAPFRGGSAKARDRADTRFGNPAGRFHDLVSPSDLSASKSWKQSPSMAKQPE
jgi:hypothetical protein